MALYVNDKRIDENQIAAEIAMLRPQYEKTFADMPEKEREQQLKDWARENVIERVLFTEAAADDKYKVPGDELEKTFQEYMQENTAAETQSDPELIKSELEKKLRLQRLVDAVCRDIPEPTGAEALKYYEENPGLFEMPETVRAAHIVKYVNHQQNKPCAYQEIKKIKQKLDQGASFEALAASESDYPEKGGDVGYFHRGQMVPEFEEAVFNLKINQVSDIILSPYGYHIAKLYDRKAPQKIDFESVKSQIIRRLKDEKRDDALAAYVDRLKGKARIEER